MSTRLILLSALALAATPATAQDVTVYGGAAIEFSIEPNGSGSDNLVELDGYIEVESAMGLYGGVWFNLADDNLLNEVDLYFGYRGEAGSGLSYDIGYARYFYPNDGGDCCGEITLGLGMPFGDMLSGSLDLSYDPENEVGSAYVGLSYQATDALAISASYGLYETGASTEREWDLGATYYVGEETAIDLRYYDGSEYTDGYVAFRLSWDTTLFGG